MAKSRRAARGKPRDAGARVATGTVDPGGKAG